MARTGPTSTPIVVHDNVFDRVIATPHMLGGTVVNWALRSGLALEGPYTFYLEWAEHPDAGWEEVAGPTSDMVLVDTQQRRFSKLPHSVYRVRLEAASETRYSDPNPLMGNWNRHDFLLAREVVRREYLLLTRYTGTLGAYLARKQWGSLCSSCADYDTGQPTNAHCTECWGTGITGGYHAASNLYLAEGRTNFRTSRDGARGMVSDQVQAARAVACPFLTAEDLWINLQTDERWAIQSKRTLVEVRGKPLVWDVELRLLPPSDIAYEIPRDWAGG
ncbi:MAG: hypothetical protein DRP45_12420 [Candidatus Zixiibacteriota bacterium]|nr:MAG: hypothetical protein DRP45_12420 [candidate division Zixibacteria bacterium]